MREREGKGVRTSKREKREKSKQALSQLPKTRFSLSFLFSLFPSQHLGCPLKFALFSSVCGRSFSAYKVFCSVII